MHACWIDWYTQLIQTQALLALGGVEEVDADPHTAFNEIYGAAGTRSRHDPEERRRRIAALAAAAG